MCQYRHEPSALGTEETCPLWIMKRCVRRHCPLRHMIITVSFLIDVSVITKFDYKILAKKNLNIFIFIRCKIMCKNKQLLNNITHIVMKYFNLNDDINY